ncbi:DUF4411 family protein [Rhodopirellula baltica]
MKRYCIDASFFINGWNKTYRIDLFPQVWSAVGNLIECQQARVSWEILKEVRQQKDGLCEWIDTHKGKIVRPGPEEQKAIRVLMRRYPNIAAQGRTPNAGDPWVIALAKAEDLIVVTDENPQAKANPNKPPKITYLCDQLGIDWMRPIDFLADVLPPPNRQI